MLSPVSARAACTAVLPTAPIASGSRAIAIDDLVRLRDIGQPEGSVFGEPSPLAISPDGREVAFLLNQADPDTNRYCRALVVVGLSGAAPRIVDQGGELITNQAVLRDLVTEIGFPVVVTPLWSPDGQWLAYLRRENGVTQLWRVRRDGSHSGAVTHSGVDVEAAGWAADGRHLLFASRPSIATLDNQYDQEGKSGWLYDGRVTPNRSPRPGIPGGLPRLVFEIDPDSGMLVEIPPGSAARTLSDHVTGLTGDLSATAADIRAWTAPAGSSPFDPHPLFYARAGAPPVRCAYQACAGHLTGLWWDGHGQELRFLRREGWNYGAMALYRWTPGRGAPQRVLLTQDILLGCVPAASRLLCLRESASTPRRVVLVDPLTGRDTLVFDPNPEFARLKLGTVTRLTWRNALGLAAWGDLVLPPDYRPGQKLPMVVVQYHSDGFLRGGTGDEYPIHLFAARAIAVLSVERAPPVASAYPNLKTPAEIEAVQSKDWAERRSLLSSLVTGVDKAIATGAIDPDRIGITGLSDGASTARFALINTHRFAAAAISSCCIEPRTVMTYAGTAYADLQRAAGFPLATQENPAFWQPYSLALNARTMGTPLLMQLADDEYLLGLETFTALREQHQPVELYVFPDEHHMKWQPAHRRAVYERNLDWFDFWLQSREDPDPAKVAQYARWREMRPGQAGRRVTP